MQMDDGHMEELDANEVARQTQKGNADLIFYVGEEVSVKGGSFKVKSIGKKMIILEGLPGTRVRT